MPKVSVIIPIYNAEKYISRCAKSLLEQTLQDIEYIFVDDCTPDNSINILNEIIESYPHRKNQIKIIHHPENKGSGAARNTGLTNANGEYVIHCDSDDWVEPEMYEEMYLKGIADNADIVTCDFLTERKDKTKYVTQYYPDDPYTNIKSILNQKLHSGVWSKLIKRSIYTDNQLQYIDGIDLWEDLLMATKTFLKAKKISYINKAFYHYNRDNSDSLVNFRNASSFNHLVRAVQEIEKYYREQNVFDDFKKEIDNLKMGVKYIHFKDGDKSMRKNAINLYSELNNSIFSSEMRTTWKIKLWILIRCPFLWTVLKSIS